MAISLLEVFVDWKGARIGVFNFKVFLHEVVWRIS